MSSVAHVERKLSREELVDVHDGYTCRAMRIVVVVLMMHLLLGVRVSVVAAKSDAVGVGSVLLARSAVVGIVVASHSGLFVYVFPPPWQADQLSVVISRVLVRPCECLLCLCPWLFLFCFSSDSLRGDAGGVKADARENKKSKARS